MEYNEHCIYGIKLSVGATHATPRTANGEEAKGEAAGADQLSSRLTSSGAGAKQENMHNRLHATTGHQPQDSGRRAADGETSAAGTADTGIRTLLLRRTTSRPTSDTSDADLSTRRSRRSPRDPGLVRKTPGDRPGSQTFPVRYRRAAELWNLTQDAASHGRQLRLSPGCQCRPRMVSYLCWPARRPNV